MSKSEESPSKVLIVLTADEASPAGCEVSERRIELNSRVRSIVVGRASKTTSKGFVAGPGNGWFNSEVMSRNHAEIAADLEEQKVTIKDQGSLHGTYLNNEVDTIPKNEPRELQNGDRVKFGVAVWRDNKQFAPTTVKVGIVFSQRDAHTQQSATFRVPEGSEDGSDIDDADYASESDAGLEKQGTEPTVTMTAKNTITTIDLTGPNAIPVSSESDRRISVPEIIDISSGAPSPVALSDDEDDSDSIYEHETLKDGSHKPTDSSRSAAALSGLGLGTLGGPEYEDTEADVYDDMNGFEDDISLSSLQENTDEDDAASIVTDGETSSNRSDDSETRPFDDESSEYSGHYGHDYMSEMDEEDISEGSASYLARAAWSPEPPSDELYDSSDVDAPRDGFWVPKQHEPTSAPEIECLPSEAPSLPIMQEIVVTQNASPELPPKTNGPFTIGRLLNNDDSLDESSLHRQPDFVPPTSASQITAAQDHGMASTIEGTPADPRYVRFEKQLAVEALGVKSGKLEYFAAREANKRLKPRDMTSSRPYSQHVLYQPEVPVLSPLYQKPNSDDVMTNATPARPNSEGVQEVSKRRVLGISDMIETFQTAKEADKTPGKRKAEDISTLSQEESVWDEQQTHEPRVTAPLSPAPSPELDIPTKQSIAPQTLPSTPVVETQAPAEEPPLKATLVDTPAVLVSEPSEVRQPKRARLLHLAERVGYVALGGVTAGAMVFGTLIYTAPSFA